jgi:thymidylate synthase (FAD)
MKIYKDNGDIYYVVDGRGIELESGADLGPHQDCKSVVGKRFSDGSFVYLKDTMGSDSTIVQAARVSYGKGTKSVSEDRNLLRYLMRHQHTTPFEMCEASWHAKMPIFVARQWVRHRTASVNEYSMRYSEALDTSWSPESWRSQSKTNKQGSDETTELDQHDCNSVFSNAVEDSYDVYEHLLTIGVAREQARAVLPVASHTEWYWKCDLKNTLHFLKLRCDSHAQKEMRIFADAMKDVLSSVFPSVMNAAEDYMFGSMSLSRLDILYMHKYYPETAFEDQDIFVNKREFGECLAKYTRILGKE